MTHSWADGKAQRGRRDACLFGGVFFGVSGLLATIMSFGLRDDLGDQHHLSLLFGVSAAALFLIGVGGVAYFVRRARRTSWLGANGTLVEARVVDITSWGAEEDRFPRHRFSLRFSLQQRERTAFFESEMPSHRADAYLGQAIRARIDPAKDPSDAVPEDL